MTRHQLLVDPRIPYTKRNSAAAIHLEADGVPVLSELADEIEAHMRSAFQYGSDPGLCVARSVPLEVIEFGRRVQTVVVQQEEARRLASDQALSLRGLGGSEDGVIGSVRDLMG